MDLECIFFFFLEEGALILHYEQPSGTPECSGVLPLVVTVAYIPAEDKEKKNTGMRLQGLAAVPAMVKHVEKVWHGSQHVVVSHVNAPDACQVLCTQLREVVPICQVVALPLLSELHVFDGPLGMRFWRTSNNEVFHQRLNIKSMGKATTQGKKFFRDMARNGMLPTTDGGIREDSAVYLAKVYEAGLCGSLYVWEIQFVGPE